VTADGADPADAIGRTGPPSELGPLVFVDDVDAPVLHPDDDHHLRRALRLRPGDEATVSDGAGRWRPVRLGAPGTDVEPMGEVVTVTRPSPPVGVAFAPVKGQRPELVVQKLTELGVDQIRPFHAARSVVRWEGARAESAHTRLQRVAREAAMQCRRAWLPDLLPIADFAAVAALPGASLADRLGGRPSLATPTVIIGPEGGWSPDERAASLPVVGLGDPVLRAETAAITAAVLLTALRAGLVH
jgi:16S rRNA (uracil1498-N3)-methyltransferase